jgi:hypothetical protein
MQRTCEGCGRLWQVEALMVPLSLLRCPYLDCRCSFILQIRADQLCVERARTFYHQRAQTLRQQFNEGSIEARAAHFLGAMFLTLLLSVLGLCHWVGASWAFFLSLSVAPLLMVSGLERSALARSWLGWFYFSSALLVISALTPSPLAFIALLPQLALSGLFSLVIIVVSGLIGGAFYGGLRYRNADRFAQQVLLNEKRGTPCVEARRLNDLPYR